MTAAPSTDQGATIPVAPWSTVAAYLNETWLPDSAPHHAVIAQTRAGKTSLIRHGLLPLLPHDRVLVVDGKGGTDPAWDGWGRPVKELPGALTLRRHDNGEPRTHWYRLVPPLERAKAREVVGDALTTILRQGRWVVVVDETRFVADAQEPNLGLRAPYEALLLRGGSAGVMVVSGTQAPRWVPSSFYDQASTAWFGRLRDEVAHKRLLEVGGMHRSLLGQVAAIPRYSWVLNADGGDYVVRTKPPKPPARPDPETDAP